MKSVDWVGEKFRFIDQTKLPHEEVFVETDDYRVVGEAIKKLSIRGAPAIGVAAAYSLVLAVNDPKIDSVDALNTEFFDALNILLQTRPTAVNLFTSLNRMRQVYQQLGSMSVKNARIRLHSEASLIQEEDIQACKSIGEFGATLITSGSTILTHCNTGALATAGTGTAQSIITTAAEQNKVKRVYADETRPLFQGARLTSWELLKQGIDVVLITDSTAGFLMQKRQIDAVIVGADRIAANGDTANKIGTYSVAVLAHHHNIPFYVAAPTSTIDLGSRSGRNIVIEERDPREITHLNEKQIAAEGVGVFAPAFDVTPNQFITAIVTEVGIHKPPFLQSLPGVKT